MTDREIITKAIDKAIDNKFRYYGVFSRERYIDRFISEPFRIKDLIFSHSFAKAFWGEEMYEDNVKNKIKVWQYHLQQMVLKEEPIKYLEKYL